MRILKWTLSVIVLNYLVITSTALAADVAKIGVIDLQRVLETSNPGKAAQARIRNQKEKMEQDLKQKGSEIEQLRQRLERESMVMSKEMREEKEREARIKLNDFKTLQQKYRAELQAVEKKEVNQLQDEVLSIIQEIGKKEGYLLVVSKIGVLYSPTTIDITDKLIQQLNQRHAKKSGN
ncbi:MAG: OmpH family outer membrane protein [Desulfobacterales bacterium]|nr:MAG: OmpH family outer membrane protein [Desulfobacterales bacterium]